MRILLPFHDDSTLMFASKISRRLLADKHEVSFLQIVEESKDSTISERQASQLLPGQDFEAVSQQEFKSRIEREPFDAVVVSAVLRPLEELLEDADFIRRSTRPCIVGFLRGIDLTPKRGFRNRKALDVVFLFRQSHIEQFEALHPSERWRRTSFGHPYSQMPKEDAALDSRKDVVFFAQSICPFTLRSRVFMVDLLNTLAYRHPERSVLLKLRHLPKENSNHLHKEHYDYVSIVRDYFAKKAPNLELVSCTMEEALKTAAFTLTCTSTAVIDSVSAGVPSMLYLDYPENYADKYAEMMRREFLDSGLIVGIPRIMRLEAPRPRSDWVADLFRNPDELYGDLYDLIHAFHQR